MIKWTTHFMKIHFFIRCFFTGELPRGSGPVDDIGYFTFIVHIIDRWVCVYGVVFTATK
jgi:hypothetical protein